MSTSTLNMEQKQNFHIELCNLYFFKMIRTLSHDIFLYAWASSSAPISSIKPLIKNVGGKNIVTCISQRLKWNRRKLTCKFSWCVQISLVSAPEDMVREACCNKSQYSQDLNWEHILPYCVLHNLPGYCSPFCKPYMWGFIFKIKAIAPLYYPYFSSIRRPNNYRRPQYCTVNLLSLTDESLWKGWWVTLQKPWSYKHFFDL